MTPSDGEQSLRIAITGATGFIGSALVRHLAQAGHSIHRVTRGAKQPRASDIDWDPERGQLDARLLEEMDAVIHLAGENVGRRWTGERRRRILDSRVRGTDLLARALASLRQKPRVLVSASAAGFYGDTGDSEVDEQTPAGTGFLAGVTQRWEAAADPARVAGIRVVHPRIGMVLHASGGALERLLLPFRLGVGGNLGNGSQYMSWILRADLLRAFEFALVSDNLEGPVNFVAPNPVKNSEFTRTLGRVLNRPAFVAVPAFALRLLFNDMADEALLAGQRVRPTRLLDAGFRFDNPELGQALIEAMSDD